jgi:type I restriction enzyme R subunit
VAAHREDRVFLEGAYREQVNGEIQKAYEDRGRYEELADAKYKDVGGIFDIMADWSRPRATSTSPPS